MNIQERMQLAYESYFDAAQQVLQNARISDGLFGMGDDPKKHPCHQVFYDSLSQTLEQANGEALTAEEAGEIVASLLHAEAQHPEQPDMVRWMLSAVQGLALPFIPKMTGADAAPLLRWYRRYYPFLERFPMQKKVIAALKKACV